MILPVADAPAVAVMRAIRGGDVAALREQLAATPGLAAARLVDGRGVSRTLLHVVADWPGHVPHGAELVAVLVQACHRALSHSAAVGTGGPATCARTRSSAPSAAACQRVVAAPRASNRRAARHCANTTASDIGVPPVNTAPGASMSAP